MINIWLSLIALFMCLSGFSLAYQISGINRTFLLLPKGIIEMSVVVIADEEGYAPYYDEKYLEEKTIDYFTINLEKYVEEFQMAFSYFQHHLDSSSHLGKNDGVVIGLKAYMIFGFEYQNALSFVINAHE